MSNPVLSIEKGELKVMRDGTTEVVTTINSAAIEQKSGRLMGIRGRQCGASRVRSCSDFQSFFLRQKEKRRKR